MFARLKWIVLMMVMLASCGPQADRPRSRNAPLASATSAPLALSAGAQAGFVLESSAVAEGGNLPQRYTCDGESATLPLAWSAPPADTQSLAVVMHHVPGPGDTHWYWVLYNLPPTTRSLPENVSGLGTLGTNSVNNRTVYAPPCSKGSGAKRYTYTVYALAAAPVLGVAADQVSRDVLLAAIADRTLAAAELNVIYSR